MNRMGIVNMTIGFLLVFLAASAGAFVALDATQRFMIGSALTWRETLHASSHGHTNLFGLLIFVFGLTLPYSQVSSKTKIWQTIGLALGAFAMGPLMLIRADLGPTEGYDLNGMFLGVCLSAALAAVGVHCYGLMYKVFARS